MKTVDLIKNERGNSLLLVSLVFAGLLAITGLVIDGAILYMNKTELQKVANAAVLSGAQELTGDDKDAVEQIVNDILTHHDAADTLSSLQVEMNQKVKVQLNRAVPIVFSKLFGVETADVQASATATAGVMGRAKGAAPLGISDEFELIFGDTYFLKVSSGDSEYGEFGILALEGPGARTYEETFRKGFNEELKIGDIVNTESGNVEGPTFRVVNEKISHTCSYNDRDCERVILVPVYHPYYADGAAGGKVKQVKITGFAYFYLLDPAEIGADRGTVPGIFIKRTGTGYEDSHALNRGAYTVRLSNE